MMKNHNLFPLHLFSLQYEGYYFDADMKVFYGNERSVNPTNTRFLCTKKFTYSLQNLKDRFADGQCDAWNEYLKNKNEGKQSTVYKPAETSGTFIIAHQDEYGVYKLAMEPKVHTTEESARTECERLAQRHPGKNFAYFERKGTCKAQSLVWS